MQKALRCSHRWLAMLHLDTPKKHISNKKPITILVVLVNVNDTKIIISCFQYFVG